MNNTYSSIVIGAGVAGCLASYRLQSKIKKSELPVLLIEQSPLVGGRIYSVAESTCSFMEFGAMRISEYQTETIDLCKELKIELEPFHGKFNQYSNLFIGGYRKKLGTFCPNPDILLKSTLTSYTAKHPLNMSHKYPVSSLIDCLEEDFECSYIHLSFNTVLEHVMTSMQYNYYRQSVGYEYIFGDDVSFFGVLTSNRSLKLDSMFYKPKSSMSKITDTLCAKFRENGGYLKLCCKAMSISKQNDHYSVRTNKGTFKAKAIILAIPIKHCSNIDGLETTGIDRSLLTKCKQCIGYYSSTKVFAVFDQSLTPENQILPENNCESFRTDLPLRQGIYPKNKNSKLQSMLIGYKNNVFSNIKIDEITAEECSKYLSQINGFTVPKPIEIYSYNWADSAAGLASHYLKCGNRYSDYLSLINSGKEKVYFIGESFSTQYGWIAGAIESVNTLLGKA